jgi:glutamate---cysteine ligase / carboxylate-amine ligase
VTATGNPVPDAVSLRREFDVPADMTVGLEEEVMLLDPANLDLLPRSADVLARLDGDPEVKGELPASQLELLSPPTATVGQAVMALQGARLRLAEAAAGIGRLAGVGVHPFASPVGVLSADTRYAPMVAEHGLIARHQLVFGLHVHVAVRPLERALAVYNALREHLPDLAALAANAPFHAGVDTGFASVRPKLSELLPRQGVPPSFAGIEDYAAALRWGQTARALTDARQWWWELRLHPTLATIEVRVCDSQPTVAETAALAAVVHALCAWLGQRHEANDLPPPARTWQIEANRWSALRHGVHGTMADLSDGTPEHTAERIERLLTEIGPAAARLGCAAELDDAHALLRSPASDRHRAIVEAKGMTGLVDWLAGRFLDGCRG